MNWRKNPPHQQGSMLGRILVGYLGLYPTLLVVLSLLNPFTRHLSFPVMVLVEVMVLVPITQLLSYPIAGWVVERIQRRSNSRG